MKVKISKKILCIFACSCLLICSFAMPVLAEGQDGLTFTAQYDSETTTGDNITQSGPLTIECHLQARMGYSKANYKVIIYAPSNVVGISINDMAVLEGNAVQLNGSVGEVEQGTGRFESITVKVTLYYSDGSTYQSYETIDVNHWCGAMHPIGSNCTP